MADGVGMAVELDQEGAGTGCETTLVIVSRAPFPKIEAFEKRMEQPDHVVAVVGGLSDADLLSRGPGLSRLTLMALRAVTALVWPSVRAACPSWALPFVALVTVRDLVPGSSGSAEGWSCSCGEAGRGDVA